MASPEYAWLLNRLIIALVFTAFASCFAVSFGFWLIKQDGPAQKIVEWLFGESEAES